MQDAEQTRPDRERVQAELVEAIEEAGGGPGVDGQNAEDQQGEQVTRPTKLIRIASMVRAHARRGPPRAARRRRPPAPRARSTSGRSTSSKASSPPSCARSSRTSSLPFTRETPSESELRIAQAQLVGWLEGLFHGIQATLFTQQAMAQQQFEEMRQRRRALGRVARRAGHEQRPSPARYL